MGGLLGPDGPYGYRQLNPPISSIDKSQIICARRQIILRGLMPQTLGAGVTGQMDTGLP
jgi:hypothetical protein